jgi:hypothetical protein
MKICISGLYHAPRVYSKNINLGIRADCRIVDDRKLEQLADIPVPIALEDNVSETSSC